MAMFKKPGSALGRLSLAGGGGGGVKSIQTLSPTTALTTLSDTFSISPVDPAQTIILITQTIVGSGTNFHYPWRVRLQDAATIVANTGTTINNGSGRTTINVIEFDGLISGIVRGDISVGLADTRFVSHSFDPARTIVNITGSYSTSTATIREYLTRGIVGATQVEFARGSYSTNPVHLSYEIVEFK